MHHDQAIKHKRLAEVEGIIIDMPLHEADIFDEISNLIESLRRGAEARNLAILGLAGAGKTILAGRLYDFAKNVIGKGASERAILRLDAPSKATSGNLISALLEAMNDEHAGRGTIGAREARIIGVLKAARVWAIILDEAHHMVSNKTARGLWEMTELIKIIGQNANIAFIFVGLPSLLDLQRANPQFARRLRSVTLLEAFDWRVPDQQADYKRILHVYDNALPFEKPAGLDLDDLAFGIYQTSSGLRGTTLELCKDAACEAINKGATKLTKVHFREVYRRKYAASRPRIPNPFSGGKIGDPVAPGCWGQPKL